jgi:hypothetical protein
MTDQNVTPTQPARVFKIGATRIVEDASMSSMDNNAIRDLLKTTYPEIANATIRETTLQDGTRCIEWVAQPGHKG